MVASYKCTIELCQAESKDATEREAKAWHSMALGCATAGRKLTAIEAYEHEIAIREKLADQAPNVVTLRKTLEALQETGDTQKSSEGVSKITNSATNLNSSSEATHPSDESIERSMQPFLARDDYKQVIGELQRMQKKANYEHSYKLEKMCLGLIAGYFLLDEQLDKAIEVYKSIVSDFRLEKQDNTTKQSLAFTLGKLADVYTKNNQLPLAQQAYEEQLTLYTQLFGGSDLPSAFCQSRLAKNLYDQGKKDLVVENASKARKTFSAQIGYLRSLETSIKNSSAGSSQSFPKSILAFINLPERFKGREKLSVAIMKFKIAEELTSIARISRIDKTYDPNALIGEICSIFSTIDLADTDAEYAKRIHRNIADAYIAVSALPASGQ